MGKGPVQLKLEHTEGAGILALAERPLPYALVSRARGRSNDRLVKAAIIEGRGAVHVADLESELIM